MRVSPKTIQALTLFVADKKELRSYLRSINFELQLERTILTATNGPALLVICIDEPNDKEDTFKTKDVPITDAAPTWLAVGEKK